MSAFDGLSHAELATLLREYLLCGHLIDRSGMAHAIARFGLDGMREIAIDEWMGASPIYTRRIRALLGIQGDGVEDIFKAMQIDIGAPPQFMDFRYAVSDHDHGEFWLDCCGALMDVEPMGEDFVVAMCHDIEDPTFDATAAATNPRARMRPVHRPPRIPAGRTPHCRWTVTIDAGAEPVPEPEAARRMAATRAARVPLPEAADRYDGPLQGDVDLEAFSRPTLIALLQEVALQGHLLTLSFADAVERRSDGPTAAELVRKQFVGIAGLAAERVCRALGITDPLRLVAVHPAFHPRSYVAVEAGPGPQVRLEDCPALGDRPGRSWADVLDASGTEVLDAIVRCADERARCVKTGRRSWRVETTAEPRSEPREVAVAKISTGADFTFERRT